jgi:acetyltransferase
MTTRNLDALFHPKSVALIGADKTPGTLGEVLARNVFGSGFDGPIMPVHAREKAIRGALAVPSIADLPEVPDLAVVAKPADELPRLVDELGRRGVRAVVAVGAGEREGGALSRRALHDAIRAAAQPYRLRVVGPNALGAVVPAHKLNASLATASVRQGDIAFIAQSNGISGYLLEWAELREVGFSAAVSVGDEADVDVADLLDYLALDYRTRAILLHVESVTDAREFMSAARVAARLKPVIVMRGGRTAVSARQVRECRGGPTTSSAVWQAAFQRAGALGVRRLTDLVAAARTLAAGVRPAGDQLVVVTNGHGAGQLAADLLVEGGGRLAELPPDLVARLESFLPPGWSRGNPVDILDDAKAERYARTVDALLEARIGDALLVLHSPSALGEPDATAAEVAKRATARRPVLTAWLGERSVESSRSLFRASRVANYPGCEPAVTAFLQLRTWNRNQRQLMETPASSPTQFVRDLDTARAVTRRAVEAGRKELRPDEVEALLEAYGIAFRPGNEVARGELALCLALRPDPVFGRIIALEPRQQSGYLEMSEAVALPPLNRSLARRLIENAGIDSSFGTHWGAPEEVLEALELLIVKVAQIACEIDEIEDLVLDPVRAAPGQAVVVGVQATVGVPEKPARDRLAIRPYPVELEEHVRLSDDLAVFLRPIRPEDEEALRSSFRRMTAEDIEMRFFARIKEIDRELAARLTQLDYDREMALGAFASDEPDAELLGIVRVAADPDNERAEYAITVRSDLKGRGLGYFLMQRILDYARRRGIREVWGSVLARNTPMLGMVRDLGFDIHRDPDEPETMHVSLRLV